MVDMPSNRSFGLVSAAIFLVMGLWPLVHGKSVYFLWVGAGLVLIFLAIATPRVLGPFNRSWFSLGMLLHAIVSPLALGILFFGLFTPFGLAMRSFGKRPLDLGFDRNAISYWILRQPPGPTPDSLTNQF